MPTLEWMGKNEVVAYHRQVPYRVLERVPEKASWIRISPSVRGSSRSSVSPCSAISVFTGFGIRIGISNRACLFPRYLSVAAMSGATLKRVGGARSGPLVPVFRYLPVSLFPSLRFLVCRYPIGRGHAGLFRLMLVFTGFGFSMFRFFGKTVSGSVGIPVSRSSRIFLSRSTSSRGLSIWRSFWAMTVRIASGSSDGRYR